MGVRHTYEEVKQMFESKGFKLLSTEYLGALEPLEYICSCGRKANIRLSKLKAGQKCCGVTSNKWSLDALKAYYKNQGCQLLAKEYFGSKSTEKLLYLCSCGKLTSASWQSFQEGHRCAHCAKVKMGWNLQHGRTSILAVPEELVRITLQEKGFKLIKYNASIVTYVCSCGKEASSHTNAAAILNTTICRDCRKEITNQRKEDGIRDNQLLWSQAVKDRDCWTCQSCNDRNKLCAHHIESWHLNPDLREVIENGITLCQTCHNYLHSNFGKFSTRVHLENFLSLIRTNFD